jgi:hypothetical protein
MDTKNIFVICPNCKNSNNFDFQQFQNSSVITCPLCKGDIMAGRDGITEQLKYYIKDKKFNNAIVLHKVTSGDSLKGSKTYVQNLSRSMGIEMKSSAGNKVLFIFSIITGLVLTYIVSYFFYPKFVYIIANDLFGMKTRGITTSSYFVASVFYGVLIYVLLIIRRTVKNFKKPKVTEQRTIPEEKIKMPEQKDFRGNAF